MSFDISNVKANNFETIPDGKYTAACTDAMLKDTKNGTGEYIQCTFTVQGGEHEGRKVFMNFNTKNANEKAIEIGQQQLKSFLENSTYSGDYKFGSVNEVPPALCGLVVGIKTKTKRDEQYGDKAEIRYFFKQEAAKPEDNIAF